MLYVMVESSYFFECRYTLKNHIEKRCNTFISDGYLVTVNTATCCNILPANYIDSFQSINKFLLCQPMTVLMAFLPRYMNIKIEVYDFRIFV